MIKVRKINETLNIDRKFPGEVSSKTNCSETIPFIAYFSAYVDKKYLQGIDLWRYIHPLIVEEIRYRFDLSDFHVIIGNSNCEKYNFEKLVKNSTSCHGTLGIGPAYSYLYCNCSDKIENDKIIPNWILSYWGTNEKGKINWTFFYNEDFNLEEIIKK